MSELLVAVFVTIFITAILTTLLNLFYQRLSARKARQAKSPSPVLVEKTYRVRGIPDKYAMSSAESLLGSILEKHQINLPIKACSLAYDPLEKSTKVATFTIRGDPKHLCHPFEIPEERLPDANRKLGQFKIFVDDHFEGFTPLNTIETREHTIDCIAISGLGGHAYGSFKEKKGDHMWLRDSLPHHIPGLRVFIYGYPSRIYQSDSLLELEGISTSFRIALRALRHPDNDNTPPKPLIFLAHSLGGLVLKKVCPSFKLSRALVQMESSNEQIDKTNFRCTYAVLLFGVPNQGMDISSLIPMAEGQPNINFLYTLDKNSELLRSLHRDFCLKFRFEDSRVISFYETKPSPTAIFSKGVWKMQGHYAVLVDRSSATHGRPWENEEHHIHAIERDHSNLVKFGYRDGVYDGIREYLQGFAVDAVKVIKLRLANQFDLSSKQIECLNDLNRPPYSEIRDLKVNNPQQGTLQWFFTSTQFRLWRDMENSSGLWIRGSPGQGKSVLAKAVLNHLDQCAQSETCLRSAKVIYFFCYNQDRDFKTTVCILRALIVQILRTSDTSVFKHLPSTYQDKPEGFIKEATIATLWAIFKNILLDPLHSEVPIYCVIDALDECEDYNELLLRIQQISSIPKTRFAKRPYVKLLVTSRPEVNARRILPTLVCVDLKATSEDIRTFVREKVQTLPANFDDKLRKEAAELMLSKAEQTFLWVSIVVKKLERLSLPSIADLRDTVKQSPTDLVTLYSGIVEQIKEGPPKVQKLVAWVVYGRRPLTLQELEAALATQMDSTTKEGTEEHRFDLTREALNSAAGIILEIVHNTVHVIHQSAKDFVLASLVGASCFNGLDPDSYLSKVCLTYLNFEDFQKGPCGSKKGLDQRKKEYPFLEYAARKWHIHFGDTGEFNKDETILHLIGELIKPKSKKLLAWGEVAGIQNLDTAEDTFAIATMAEIPWLTRYQGSLTKLTKEKVIEAFKNVGNGLELIEGLLQKGNLFIDQEAILELITTGNEKIVKILLDNNYTGNLTSESIALAAAANQTNSLAVIRLLVEHKRNKIALTGDLVIVAENNPVSGRSVIQYLLNKSSEISEAAVEEIVRLFDIELIQKLVHEKYDLKLTEAVSTIAASRQSSPRSNLHTEIMKILLSSDTIQITEHAVAVISLRFDASVVGLLLRGRNILVTGGVMEVLWRKFGSQIEKRLTNEQTYIQITETAVVVATKKTRSNGRELINFLLSRSDMKITEDILIAVAGNEMCGKEMMEVILNNKDVNITEAVIQAALCNRAGENLVELLFNKDGVHITAALVEEAVRHSGISVETLELCLHKLPLEYLLKVALATKKFSKKLLPIAIYKGHKNLACLLIENGANFIVMDDYGRTALQIAARNGYETIVQFLLNGLADKAEMKMGFNAALCAASYAGHDHVVQLLLQVGSDTHFQAHQNARLAAAEERQIEIKNQQLIAESDVNTSPCFLTALQAAAVGGHLEIVDKLLAAGSDINAAPGVSKGRTALQAAAEGGHFEILERLLAMGSDVNALPSKYYGLTALQAAAERGHLKSLEKLLAVGSDINALPSEEYGRTALQAAAGRGHLEIVEKLLAVGSDVNALPAEEHGRTALQAAAEGGHLDIVEKLLAAGSDVNALPCESSGRTALQAAAEGGHLEIVEKLLAAGSDVNAWSSDRTALKAAAKKGHFEIVEKLLAAGSDVNALPSEFDGRTALQAAAEGGHLDIVEKLLAAGSDVNALPSKNHGRTALQTAAEGGHLEIVEKLLAAGSDINALPSERNGRTALRAAAEGGHLEIVEKLLAAGSDVNALPCESNGCTALQAAAEGGHLEIVEKLLAAGSDVDALPSERNGRTALGAAIEGGHFEIVEKLLAAGSNVNALPSEDSGRTALQTAAEWGHLDIVEKLLAAGSDVNALPYESSGRTALQAAAEGGYVEIVEKLLTAGSNVNALLSKVFSRTALHAAVEGGHLEIVEKLLAAGSDVNLSYVESPTVLQTAAERGYLEIVEKLLAAGSDVNALPSEFDGRTALQAAAEGGHLEIVERLLAAGSNINASPSYHYGCTTLQAAAKEGHLDIVEKLLDAGCDINALPSGRNGRTALQAAAERGHLDIMEKLLAAGSDVNALPSERNGRTALQAAAERGHLDIVEMLLAAGSDVNALPSERNGRTALQAAAEGGHLYIVEKLLAAGSDVNALPSRYDGRTVLQAAAKKGHLEIVEKLRAAGAKK